MVLPRRDIVVGLLHVCSLLAEQRQQIQEHWHGLRRVAERATHVLDNVGLGPAVELASIVRKGEAQLLAHGERAVPIGVDVRHERRAEAVALSGRELVHVLAHLCPDRLRREKLAGLVQTLGAQQLVERRPRALRPSVVLQPRVGSLALLRRRALAVERLHHLPHLLGRRRLHRHPSILHRGDAAPGRRPPPPSSAVHAVQKTDKIFDVKRFSQNC